MIERLRPFQFAILPGRLSNVTGPAVGIERVVVSVALALCQAAMISTIGRPARASNGIYAGLFASGFYWIATWTVQNGERASSGWQT
jgi:hypothetical protein